MKLLAIVIFCFFFSVSCVKSYTYCDCLRDQAEEYLILGYAYEWGDWDCSKFIEQIMTDCGIEVERCTSKDYAEGRCGFDSDMVPLQLRISCDFAFWTWPKSKRIFGHTGMFEKKEIVYHNSSTAGKVIKSKVTPKTYYGRHLKRVRRLRLEE